MMRYSPYLPHELWNEAASYLDGNDLASLSQTNKQLASISSRLLYKSPVFERPDNGTHLMSLLQTLLEYPQLLDQVRSLTFPVTNCQVPSIEDQNNSGLQPVRRLGPGGVDRRRRSPAYQTIRQRLLSRLKECSIAKDTHPAWIASIESWSVAAIFGGLLMLLPNLKHLSLSCYYLEQMKNFRPSKGDLCEMLFSKKGVALTSYDFLQHLKIESLEFSGQFTDLFLRMPQLQRLRLGRMTELELTPGLESNLTHVEMYLIVSNNYDQSSLYTALKTLLAPSVRHLTAYLVLPVAEQNSGTCITNKSPLLEYLLQDLHQIVPDLKTLELKPQFGWDPSGSMPAIARQFQKLGRLAIYYQPHKKNLQEIEGNHRDNVNVFQ